MIEVILVVAVQKYEISECCDDYVDVCYIKMDVSLNSQIFQLLPMTASLRCIDTFNATR